MLRQADVSPIRPSNLARLKLVELTKIVKKHFERLDKTDLEYWADWKVWMKSWKVSFELRRRVAERILEFEDL